MLVSMGAPPSMGNWLTDFGRGVKDVANGAVNIALSPITIPLHAAGDVIGQVGGAAANVIGAAGGAAGGLVGALRPPAQASPDYSGLLAGGAGAGSSSKLPIILGGVAALGLLAFALTRKKAHP